MLGALIAADAGRAAEFPTKPVRIFVPYGPGGAGDLTVRIVAQKMSEDLNQRFVIENRPGAGGTIAMKGVLEASADGYVLGEMGGGQSIATTLFTHLPYDILKDFSPIGVAASFPVLVAVAGNSPYHSIKDVVEAARKNPGKLNLGAINPGSTQNLSAHLFKQVTGADVTIIPFRTTPDLITALLRGDVDAGFDYYAGFEGSLSDGRLRIIATSGEARDVLLKDVPTSAESGFPQYVATSWNGLTTRAGAPAEVIRVLNAELNRALTKPDVQQRLRGLGLEGRGSTPDEMRARLTNDIAKWRDVINKAGIPKQ
jgi:tripartite-type tricarboxylate transporter receptor subunit TctC